MRAERSDEGSVLLGNLYKLLCLLVETDDFLCMLPCKCISNPGTCIEFHNTYNTDDSWDLGEDYKEDWSSQDAGPNSLTGFISWRIGKVWTRDSGCNIPADASFLHPHPSHHAS